MPTICQSPRERLVSPHLSQSQEDSSVSGKRVQVGFDSLEAKKSQAGAGTAEFGTFTWGYSGLKVFL